MKPAIWAEMLRLAGSTVGRVGSIAIVAGIASLSAAMLLAAASGDPQLIAKLGPAAARDWTGFLLAAAQITSAGGLLGFGVVLSWMFGREFGDGTITGLFGLPVRRSTISLAKLVVYGGWAVVMSIALAGALLLLGVAAGLGLPSDDAWPALARQVGLGAMTAAVAAPIAWAATLGRSVLAGVSTAIGLVVIAQVSVLAGAGAWFPLASPALWAISSGEAATPGQLLLVLPYVGVFVLLTAASWRTMQLDR